MAGLTMIMTPEQDSTSLLSSSSSMSIEEVADRLSAMQNQESIVYVCHNYIDNKFSAQRSSPSSSRRRPRKRGPQENQIIDRDCRSKMCEWCYQVADFCKFERETVAISMNYLDRFLSTSSPRAILALQEKKEFQLVAMTTLYIAVKLFEPLAMDAGLLAQISHGCYTETDVVEMEKEILKSLSWRVNGPTTHAFLNHIMALLPRSAYYDKTTLMTLVDFSRFQIEIAVSDYGLSLSKPSTVALAALVNSIEGIEKRFFPARSRFQFFQLIAEVSGMNPFSPEVNVGRSQLLALFSKNSGYELPQIANLTPVMRSGSYCMEQKLLSNSPPSTFSPVCVSRHVTSRRDTYGAKCA
eukprot:CAMPEP_0183724022 /NCGR_PEP_ID=MMETSP0737-20130205/17053_1 /TAXON_ID=385413 /ORGANISM="Thalassiosira miniscula, Strain CCMP1093" /LENGTH=353 /DNA_ID=CAMNT_0025954475 /DNA_START=86 /DNA_END=1147 /DNA_ORIENTATION=-